MQDEYDKKTDEQLIHLVVSAPDSTDGRAAKEILEYRKYLTTKRHNAWLLVLTIVLAGSAILQVILKLLPRCISP